MIGGFYLFGNGLSAFSKADKETRKKIIAGLFSLCLALVGALIMMKTVIEPTMIGLKNHNSQQSTNIIQQNEKNDSSKSTINNNSNENNSQEDLDIIIYVLKQPIVIFMFTTVIIVSIGKWVYKKI